MYNIQLSGIDFEITFSDITILEADGIYKEVKKIMKGEWPHKDDWMVRTTMVIDSLMGRSEMLIHCYNNKDVYIMEYAPSMRDTNLDIQCLHEWTQQSGWNIPRVHYDLIKSDRVFWKNMWDTLLIDSEYLDNIYGKRPQLE